MCDYDLACASYRTYLCIGCLGYDMSSAGTVLGTSWLGYELYWVRVILGTNCPGYDFSWARGDVCTSWLRHELDWVRVGLGRSCPGYELSWVRSVLGMSCPDPSHWMGVRLESALYTVELLCVWNAWLHTKSYFFDNSTVKQDSLIQ